jgi:hypothetical protein
MAVDVVAVLVQIRSARRRRGRSSWRLSVGSVLLVALFVRVLRRTRVRAAAVLARVRPAGSGPSLSSAIGGGRFDISDAERRGSASGGSACGVEDDACIQPFIFSERPGSTSMYTHRRDTAPLPSCMTEYSTASTACALA